MIIAFQITLLIIIMTMVNKMTDSKEDKTTKQSSAMVCCIAIAATCVTFIW